MAYYKSYSNYTIKDRHQNTDDGIVYERDITTIGGLNQFAKGERPIYQSGNFIITVQNDSRGNKDYSSGGWVPSPNKNPNVWTGDDLSSNVANKQCISNNINRDYYILKDFAYYGSCNELIRVSILNIVNSFPGELYSPFTSEEGVTSGFIVFYKDPTSEDTIRLGDDDEYLLDNPFDINIHTNYVSLNEHKSPLKYFCNNGYKNYEILFGDQKKSEPITDYSVTWLIDQNNRCALPGTKIAVITLNKKYVISAYMGSDKHVVYLTNVLDMHIRPLTKFYASFYNGLSLFETILLNNNSQPKYTATFEITQETQFGFETKLQRFTFPRSHGDYNLSIGTQAYETYLNSLSQIAVFYDNYFCDNLYRVMTHESIKNFDWTDQSDETTITKSKDKIKHLLHLFGYEFDVIKSNIDNLKYASNITYRSSNYTTQMLNNLVSNEGWQVPQIMPYIKNNGGLIYNNSFSVKPYSDEITHNCYPNGYYINVTCESDPITTPDSYKTPADDSKRQYRVINGTLRPKIQSYSSNQEYDVDAINNAFLKNLKLNSKNIFRHKGTIEGVEMILGLLGLKSKRWYDLSFNEINGVKSPKNSRYFNLCDLDTEKSDYDYEIKEYVAYTNPILDQWDTARHDYLINFYNKAKTFIYDTPEYRNGVYTEYRGLPVENHDLDGKRYLVPNFEKQDNLDGSPYYQMNGGWMRKSHTVNKDSLINNIYTETIKEILTVQTIKDLLSVPFNKLQDKVIYKVLSLDGSYVLINGELFVLDTEYRLTNDKTIPYRYFSTIVNNGQINIGNQCYSGVISISYELDTLTNDIKERTIDLNDIENGRELRIFEVNGVFTIHDSYFERSDFADMAQLNAVIFDKDQISSVANGTNYFQLNKKDEYKLLSLRANDKLIGWVRLLETDDAFKQIGTLTNNFSGNNPHAGKFKYDDGVKYLNIYKNLFGEAIGKKAINFECFPTQTKEEVLCDMDKFGFKNIENRVESIKIEYFGNIFVEDGENIKEKKYVNVIKDNDNEYNISDANMFPQYAQYKPISGFTNQIINTKYIDINFYCNEMNIEFIKFMDEVVLKYLEQMIPLNSIIRIIYHKLTKNGE